MKTNKVCVNLNQSDANNGGFTDDEKWQARKNIGALGPLDVLTANRYDWTSPTTPIKVDRIGFHRTGIGGGEIKADNTSLGSTVPLPARNSEEGKLPVAYYRDGRGYYLLERVIPTHTATDKDKVLSIDNSNALVWKSIIIPSYTAGNGISINNNKISWEYGVGRNLHINQNNNIQTNLPGGLYTAPTTMASSFMALTDSIGKEAEFAGAYRLMCRHNTSDKYELAISYTASGMSSTFTFIGTETVMPISGGATINPATYINEGSLYSPIMRFGATSNSTMFDPTIHKAIIYQGVAQIGPTSNTQIAIWNDNGTVKISFTAIEVGKVGSTV